MTMTADRLIDKILLAIQRKGGTATLTGIKRSIAEFNQSGGVPRLKQYLADLVSNGTLLLHNDQGGKGQSIETYRLAKSTVGSLGGNRGNANLTITVSLDIGHKGLLDALLTFLNVDDGSISNEDSDHESKVEAPAADAEENNPFDDFLPDDELSDSEYRRSLPHAIIAKPKPIESDDDFDEEYLNNCEDPPF